MNDELKCRVCIANNILETVAVLYSSHQIIIIRCEPFFLLNSNTIFFTYRFGIASWQVVCPLTRLSYTTGCYFKAAV